MIKKIKEHPIVELSLILILAIIIKGWNIGETDLGFDESFSLYNAQLPISSIIPLLTQGDNPPLWELLLHYWISIFGIAESNIRVLSLVFNVVTIIPLYFIGERFIGKRAGILVSLLFVFSSFSLFLTHEARVYSLIGFLASWSVYFYLKILNDQDSIKSLVFLSVVNILIIYSHYIAVWLIIVQVLIYLLNPSIRKKLGKNYRWHIISLFLFFLPLTSVIYARLLDSGVKGTWIQKSKGIESLYFMLVDFFNEPVVTVVLLLMLFLGTYNSFNNKRLNHDSLIINLMVWIPLLVTFLISFKLGIFLNRYFYFTLPILYLSLVNVIFKLKLQNKYLKAITFSLPLLLMVCSFEISTVNMIHSGNHKEIKGAIEKVKQLNNTANISICFSPALFDKQFVYYYNQSIFTSYFDKYEEPCVFKDTLTPINIYPINNIEDLDLDKITNKIIYLDKDNKNGSIVDALKKTYKLESQELIGDVLISTFIK